MTKAEFKKQIMALLSSSVDGLDQEDKAALVRRAATEFEKGNRGKPLTRESLGLTTNSALFSVARQHMKTRCGLPKRSNVIYGSIEQIYRWAGQIADARADVTFFQRIKRIRKELGWRSVGGDK